MGTGMLRNSAEDRITKYLRHPTVDRILRLLEPYKPKKLILGSHFIKSSMIRLKLSGKKPKHKYMYRGIPVEKSEDKYQIDFEV